MIKIKVIFIFLTLALAPCQDIQAQVAEICDNGLDDDGDGLIDGYDPDCCEETADFYYNGCGDVCPRDTSLAFGQIDLKYEVAGLGWHEGNTPVVGDIDGDGEAEVIGVRGEINPLDGRTISTSYLIINGEDGSVSQDYTPTRTGNFSRNLTIADTDGDGFGEIYSNTRALTRHDVTPGGSLVRRWIANCDGLSQPSVTDFNEDGIPEILVDNAIYDSRTGAVLVALDNMTNEGRVGYNGASGGSQAVDILPDSQCMRCEGKELVLGNQIFSVDIQGPGTSSIQLEVEFSAGQDGYTAIVDWDLDGDLDVVLATNRGRVGMSSRFLAQLQVWEGQAPDTLTSVYFWSRNLRNGLAQPAVGDVTGDGLPDVVAADNSTLRAVSYVGGKWEENFIVENNDLSGMSGSSLFDFNLDGRKEIVHRDENSLRILDGLSGSVLFQDLCPSRTGYDVPTIADVDGDGEAEVLCSCDAALKVYEAPLGAWPITRPVWHQLLYNPVMVNDDLTIPAVQQDHHLATSEGGLNFIQGQYGRRGLSAPDFIATVSDRACMGDSTIFEIEICNQGSIPFQGPVSVSEYDGDPYSESAALITTVELPSISLDTNDCQTLEVTLLNTAPVTWLVLNDNGGLTTPFDLGRFPSTSVPECQYGDNLLRLRHLGVSEPFDLGTDTALCDFGDLSLFAPDGFFSFVWQDGRQDSVITPQGPGLFILTAVDSCGEVFADSLRLTQQDLFERADSATICKEDSIFIAGEWRSPGRYEVLLEGVDCDTILTIDILENESLILSLPDTIIVELGTQVQIAPDGDTLGIVRALWEGEDLSCRDCISTTFSGRSSGLARVQVTDFNGCSSFLTTYIEVFEKEYSIFIPNAFSPDGNNLNDRLIIDSDDPGAILEEVQVFDRWGELVHLSSGIPLEEWSGWDGQLNGVNLSPGVYVISIHGRHSSGRTFQMTSDVTLLR
jgi:gliding motility-associated-like protein